MSRYSKAGAAALFALLSVVAVPTEAQAHEYYESSNIRIYGCALSGKYGCQSRYLRRFYTSAYGWLYEDRHAHVCTDKGGDSSWWRPEVRDYNQGSTVWADTSHGTHQHNSEWCGQSVSIHMWYPNANVASGNNKFRGKTVQYFPIGPVIMECWHDITNFSGTSNYTGGTNASPSNGNC